MTGYFFPFLCNIFHICRVLACLLTVLLPALILATGLAAQSLPSGGSVTEQDRGGERWRVHIYETGSRARGYFNLTVPNDTPISSTEYLVVGGGGAGGEQEGISATPYNQHQAAAGGGGGGEVSSGSFVPESGSYTVIVGEGGQAASSLGADGDKGGLSTVIGPVTVLRARGGGTPSDRASKRNGGSGAGGWADYHSSTSGNIAYHAPGTGVAGGNGGQGCGTANATSYHPSAGGGGGGAGGNGEPGTTNRCPDPADGGSGLASNITNTKRYYGGGGAGAQGYLRAGNGTNGLGGGGGGDAEPYDWNQYRPGHGGSGVVILAYRAPWPTPVISSSASAPVSGVFTARIDFNLPVSGFDMSDIVVGNATLSNFQMISDSEYSVDVTPVDSGMVTLYIADGAAQDKQAQSEGNNVQSKAATKFKIEASLNPVVTAVTSTSANGWYRAGDNITLQVRFDKPVTVSGDLTLDLETGAARRYAKLISGSGSDTLSFVYTVQPGDRNDDLDYTSDSALQLAGGNVSGENGLDDADLTLPAPGAAGSLGAARALQVDAVPPVVSQSNIAVSGATGTGGTFKVGDTVTVDWNVAGGDGDAHLDAVTVDFSKLGGGNSVVAQDLGGRYRATYVIAANASSSGTEKTVSVSASDLAGNLTATDSEATISVDAIPPAIGAATIVVTGATGENGTFHIGDTLSASWDAAADGNSDIASAMFDFSEFGGPAAVAASLVGDVWTATFDVTPGTIDATGLNVTITATDAVGNEMTLAGTSNETLDNIAPIVQTGNITVSGATGPDDTFRVGDKVNVLWSNTNADAISRVIMDLSAFGGPTDMVATAQGDDWFASHVIGAGAIRSSDAEVMVMAFDDAGNAYGQGSDQDFAANTVLPRAEITGPSDLVTGIFEITISFSEAVTGLEQADLSVENGMVVGLDGAGASYHALIDPVLGKTVAIHLPARSAANDGGNGNEISNELLVSAGSPASEFDRNREEIREVITTLAVNQLRGRMAVNRRLLDNARDRFMMGVRQTDETASRNAHNCDGGLHFNPRQPFDVDGSVGFSNGIFGSSGRFAGASGGCAGEWQRYIFGDFDIQVDDDVVTGTAYGRMAWEKMVSGRTLIGGFLGAEIARSDIDGAFDGNANAFGATAGGYLVHRLHERLFADGYATIGVGRTDLSMDNATLFLDSNYNTQFYTLGASLTGMIPFGAFELWPQLALAHGRGDIGNVDFLGRAYGLTDGNLRLDAGDVTISSLHILPEFRWSLDRLGSEQSNALMTFAPAFICERVDADHNDSDCGGGAEISLSWNAQDGRTNTRAAISVDQIGDRTHTVLDLQLEHRF